MEKPIFLGDVAPFHVGRFLCPQSRIAHEEQSAVDWFVGFLQLFFRFPGNGVALGLGEEVEGLDLCRLDVEILKGIFNLVALFPVELHPGGLEEGFGSGEQAFDGCRLQVLGWVFADPGEGGFQLRNRFNLKMPG
jgi:hypothetical protein